MGNNYLNSIFCIKKFCLARQYAVENCLKYIKYMELQMEMANGNGKWKWQIGMAYVMDLINCQLRSLHIFFQISSCWCNLVRDLSN